MEKQLLLTELKNQLQSKLITEEEVLSTLERIKCYFCQNPVPEAEHYQTSFWNGNKKDKRLVCYICLRYSYQRNLPLISETKKEIFLEYERAKLFSKS